jgi:hypothetical protein
LGSITVPVYLAKNLSPQDAKNLAPEKDKRTIKLHEQILITACKGKCYRNLFI